MNRRWTTNWLGKGLDVHRLSMASVKQEGRTWSDPMIITSWLLWGARHLRVNRGCAWSGGRLPQASECASDGRNWLWTGRKANEIYLFHNKQTYFEMYRTYVVVMPKCCKYSSRCLSCLFKIELKSPFICSKLANKSKKKSWFWKHSI